MSCEETDSQARGFNVKESLRPAEIYLSRVEGEKRKEKLVNSSKSLLSSCETGYENHLALSENRNAKR